MAMIQVRRVLCPVDFSDFSRRALDHATAWARWYGSSLALLHVYTLPIPPSGLFTDAPFGLAVEPQLRKEAARELARLAAPVEAGGLPVEALSVTGDTVSQILAQAAALPADLLVLGTHGRGGFERWVLGSVTEKILRKAPCPVLVVPPETDAAARAAPVAYRSILCPLDFSPSSFRALEYALALAQEARARLTVLHVLEWLPEDLQTEAAAAITLSEYRSRLMREAQDRLRQAIPAEARDWCEPQEMLAAGKPYREVLRVAEETSADLIVMGCHGRNPIEMVLFGSTTHQIVRAATCPVLTIRSQA